MLNNPSFSETDDVIRNLEGQRQYLCGVTKMEQAGFGIGNRRVGSIADIGSANGLGGSSAPVTFGTGDALRQN
jgi:hypothetical protein